MASEASHPSNGLDAAGEHELAALIVAEIDAIGAVPEDDDAQVGEDSTATDPDSAERDFIELAARWLSRRPHKVRLLEQLCRAVLNDPAFALPCGARDPDTGDAASDAAGT